MCATPSTSRATSPSTQAPVSSLSGPGLMPAPPQNTFSGSPGTDDTSAVGLCHFAAALIDRITDLVRVSVCLSLPHRLLSRKLNAQKNQKYHNRSQGKSNRWAYWMLTVLYLLEVVSFICSVLCSILFFRAR